MEPQNKYAHRSKLSEYQVRRIVKLFALDLEAAKIAELVDVSHRTVNRYVMALRKRMAEQCEKNAKLSEDIEVDEAYFGPSRVRGKRGPETERKLLFLVSSNATDTFTQRSYQTLRRLHCRL